MISVNQGIETSVPWKVDKGEAYPHDLWRKIGVGRGGGGGLGKKV